MDRELFKLLTEDLPKINRIVQNINHGGCLIFAHALKQEFDQFGIKSSIHVVGIDLSDLIEMLDFAETSNINVAYQKILDLDMSDIEEYYQFPHAMVRVEDRFYDSDGVHLINMQDYTDALDDKTVNILLSRHDLWNSDFRWSNSVKAVDAITKYMENCFNKLL